MRLIHISDLHIGKRVNEFSMLEDQKYILDQILNIVEEKQIDAVMIAGDIYDKAVPTAEAVCVFDYFLTKLRYQDIKVFIISGNHDSPERIAFGRELMKKSGIYISPVFQGKIEPISIKDDYGRVNFYLLPFLKPALIRPFYPQQEISSYEDGLNAVIQDMDISKAERNILVAHQFVIGAETCDSEELSVGGLDQVPSVIFEGFDYVALGHLHGPQYVGKPYIRYSGSPLKYSFSEINHKKQAVLVELREKGSVTIEKIYLKSKRELRKLRGSYEEITYRKNYENTATDDYLEITLTDEDEIPEALNRLRVIYPNIMRLEYDNCRTRTEVCWKELPRVGKIEPMDLFRNFFESQNGTSTSQMQEEYLKDLIQKIWEEER